MSPADSTAAARRSIGQTFQELRSRGQLALMPFIPAGFPDLETTAATVRAVEQAGASLVEIGIPFSDPIADGPVIQEAFTAALSRKLRLRQIFETVTELRRSVSLPMVSMVSYSIVFRYGLDRFIAEAKQAGFDGLILPDLPPPEADAVCRQVQAGGLDTILLISPTTNPSRREQIARLCSGFIYYLSVTGITGERDRLPEDLADNLRQLRGITDRPVAVGFGISKPQHLSMLSGVADGAIVGSAIVRRMQQHLEAPPQRIAEVVGQYCGELLSAVR